MTRLASILLEVLLATAVFAFAGIVVLGTVDEALADTARGERRAVAMDLARSRMAMAEAGGDVELATVEGLRVEFRTEPSDYPGLALAPVEVYDDGPGARTAGGAAPADARRLAVLRQLLRADGGTGAERPEFRR